MIRFTVVWEPDFYDEFIRSWIDADSSLRAALTRASDWIDSNLCSNPEVQGRPSEFDPTCRTIKVPNTEPFSIVALYRVRHEDRQVDIVSLQHTPNL